MRELVLFTGKVAAFWLVTFVCGVLTTFLSVWALILLWLYA